MKVVISGASGLIGSALRESFERDGHEVVRLVRQPSQTPGTVEWHPGERPLDPTVLADADAVINLNGASIARMPWTPSYERTLLESRIHPTETLATALRSLGRDAPALISASAVGFYGHRPGETLTEQSGGGSTFLAKLCREWEARALAAGPGARVVCLRTAPVLHPEAVLKPLITLTSLGLGGPLGSGEQVWPWISLADEVRAIRFAAETDLEGPVNLVGPETVTMNEIGRMVAQRLKRPYLLPAPAFALRAALSRHAADSLLLADQRIVPEVLTRAGFSFCYPTVADTLAKELSEG